MPYGAFVALWLKGYRSILARYPVRGSGLSAT